MWCLSGARRLTLTALLLVSSLTAAAPCANGQLGFVEEGPLPAAALRAAVREQLEVEAASAGTRLCDGDGTSTLVLRWSSPERVTLDLRRAGPTLTRTVSQGGNGLPLAVAVVAAGLLAEAARGAEPIEAAPEPPRERAPTQPRGLVALTAEGLVSTVGTLFGGGAVSAELPLGRLRLHASLGALTAPTRTSTSGRTSLTGLTAGLGAGVAFLTGPVFELGLRASVMALALRSRGEAVTPDSEGLERWTPAVSLRAGPVVRWRVAGPLHLVAGGGVGGWVRAIRVLDGDASVGGLGGLEGWLQLGGALAW